jgi:RimJ/RimL family protein N-acetyltransferase
LTDLAPLFRLRLRTPRLELRLPARAELDELRQVALAGIHPPEFMPFGVAWTDDPELSDFLDFHEGQLAAWRRDDWNLNLGVWFEGAPAGTQSVHGRDFPATKAIGTGSWLGARFQGRGIGTEMRAAALELAFRGLGAEVARSGAIDGNEASLRVSEKLGYRIVGHSTVAPRGEELDHADLELRREEWRPPFPVEIEGLEGCLPLFGLGDREDPPLAE